MADIEDEVAGHRPIQRRHQQAAARRAEGVGDRRDLAERFASDFGDLCYLGETAHGTLALALGQQAEQAARGFGALGHIAA